MVQEFKELRSDENDPLFDKTNMLKKEFPSDFRQIRYFTLLIVQSAPTEIKELNLLEQSALLMHILLYRTKVKDLKILKNGMNSTKNVLNVSTIMILWNFQITFHSVQKNQTARTVVTHCLPLWNIGTADSYTTVKRMP